MLFGMKLIRRDGFTHTHAQAERMFIPVLVNQDEGRCVSQENGESKLGACLELAHLGLESNVLELCPEHCSRHLSEGFRGEKLLVQCRVLVAHLKFPLCSFLACSLQDV